MTSFVLRKAITLYRNPIKALRKKHLLFGLIENYARWRFERAGLMRLIAGRPADAIAPVFHDLWRLYRAAQRAETIVEFGCGCSTFVMGEALRRRGHGHLYVFDANKAWLERARDELPRNLLPFVTMAYRPMETCEIGGARVCRYADVPDIEADLIYVDGPHNEYPLRGEARVTANPLFMRRKPGTKIILDGRKPTRALFTQMFGRPRWSLAVLNVKTWVM